MGASPLYASKGYKNIAKQASLSTWGENILPSTGPYQVFEGPLSAFRNHAGSNSASTKLSQISLSAHPSESQLVVPSMLLLDGSSVASTATNLHLERQNDMIQNPNDPLTSSFSLEQSQELIHQQARSSVASIESLQARLPRRSSSIIRHVQSVLRYSSTNSLRSSISWRSSWISLRSQNSIKSGTSTGASLSDDNSIALGAGNKDPATSVSEERYHQPAALSSTLLPNPENQVRPISITIRHPTARLHNRALKKRGCDCIFTLGKQPNPNSWPELCENCGIRPAHLLAFSLAGVTQILDLRLDIGQKDYLNNGPLHFAAMAADPDPETFIKLIDMGANVGFVTTFGETFIHVLFRYLSPKLVPDFLPLFQRLEALDFSFSSRDYLGRQPFHILLGRRQGLRDFLLNPPSKLEEVFAIVKPDFDALSSAGQSLRCFLSEFSRTRRTRDIADRTFSDRLLSSYPKSKNIAVDFEIKMKNLLSKVDYDWSRLIEWLAIGHRAVWIDCQGNTALIALLKCWSSGQNELKLVDIIHRMVRLGVEIHMRDREGETALAIAARRGLRPAATTLIESGASIHTTTLRGISILSNARKSLLQTKDNGDDKLYARVLSCIVYLVDRRACEFPSERRQRWAAWAPDSHFGWEEKDERSTNILKLLAHAGYL
jgi:ankyrin repeat protein